MYARLKKVVSFALVQAGVLCKGPECSSRAAAQGASRQQRVAWLCREPCRGSGKYRLWGEAGSPALFGVLKFVFDPDRKGVIRFGKADLIWVFSLL